MRLSTVIISGALLLAMPATMAAPRFGSSFNHGEAHNAVKSGKHIKLDRVYKALEKAYGGEDVRFVGLFSRAPGQSAVYEIIWLTGEGRRVVFEVDAETGQVLSQRGG